MKIAVIDSGIGGLRTITQITKAVKGNTFYYLCDRKNLPYGNKSKETLYRILKENISYVSDFSPDVLVLACNTMSTMFYKIIKDEYPFDIVPVLPPLNRAVGKTLLLATENTVNNSVLPPGVKPVNIPCLASVLEQDAPNIDRAVKCLNKLNISDFDSVVLGCTHYGYLTNYFKQKHPGLNVLDGVEDAVNKIVLKGKNLFKKDFVFYKVTDGSLIKEELFCGLKNHCL